MNLNSECGDVFFLKFSCQVALDKCGFPCSTVANEDKLEGGDFGCSHCNNLEKEIEKEDEGREQVAQRKVAKDRLDSWKYLTKQSQRI